MNMLVMVKPLRRTLLAWLLAACGGGGGGGVDNATQAVPTEVSYGIGAPQSALAQQSLTIDLGSLGSTLRRIAAEPTAENFVFPGGPDSVGDALPKLSRSYNTLMTAYDQAPHSKLWIDLPASAGGYQVAVAVTKELQSRNPLAKGELIAGELTIVPRATYVDFSGQIRLTFSGTAPPACLAWDSQADGSFESEQCMTVADLIAL